MSSPAVPAPDVMKFSRSEWARLLRLRSLAEFDLVAASGRRPNGWPSHVSGRDEALVFEARPPIPITYEIDGRSGDVRGRLEFVEVSADGIRLIVRRSNGSGHAQHDEVAIGKVTHVEQVFS